jgi:hypothetical protein
VFHYLNYHCLARALKRTNEQLKNQLAQSKLELTGVRNQLTQVQATQQQQQDEIVALRAEITRLLQQNVR